MATDARIAVGLSQHPKTKKLIRRLGQSAGWNLVCLILWAAENRSDGRLSSMSVEDIEIAADWMGDEGAFVSALVDVRFLDEDGGCYVLHDWHEHNPWAAGADMRSAKARWNAAKRHHGAAEADRLVPEYAAIRSAASNADSRQAADDGDAGSNAPSPSPSPSPSPQYSEADASVSPSPTPAVEADPSEAINPADAAGSQTPVDASGRLTAGLFRDGQWGDGLAGPAVDPGSIPGLEATTATPKPGKVVPDCPHAEILALWQEVLPAMPQHMLSQWRGTRSDHLRVRWREAAVERGWRSQAEGLAFFRKLFAYIGKSAFLTGKVPSSTGRKVFQIELEWLVVASNWARVIEGKYHEVEAMA